MGACNKEGTTMNYRRGKDLKENPVAGEAKRPGPWLVEPTTTYKDL